MAKKKVEFLYLSRQDVESLGIPMKEIINAVETSFREHGMKRVQMPPKPGVHSRPNAFIHAMPAYVPKLEALGIKWVSGYPQARKYGLPYIMGLLILNDVETGAPYCVMECGLETAMRTGAASAVAAKYLARENSENIAIIGLGEQGRWQLIALNEVIDIKQVKVYDIVKEAQDRYVKEMSEKVDVRIIPTESARDAIIDADIVVTACSEDVKPFVEKDWLKEGVLCLPLELNMAYKDEAIFSMDKIVVDDWPQTREHVKLTGREIPEPYAELGEIVAGKKPGRETDKEKIWDSNYGLAVHDVIVGKLIYEKAIKKGIGTKLTLM